MSSQTRTTICRSRWTLSSLTSSTDGPPEVHQVTQKATWHGGSGKNSCKTPGDEHGWMSPYSPISCDWWLLLCAVNTAQHVPFIQFLSYAINSNLLVDKSSPASRSSKGLGESWTKCPTLFHESTKQNN